MKMKSTVMPALALVASVSTLLSVNVSTAVAKQTVKATNSVAVSGRTQFPLTVTDDTGRKVVIHTRPHHIASATEGTDEILTALVPKKDIAMVTTYASQPDYSNVVSLMKGIPAIQNASAESIIAVHPDLVLLASYTSPTIVKQIEHTNIPAYEFNTNNFNSIPDIEQNIEVVGRLVGQKTKAQALVATMQKQIRAIEHAVGVNHGKRVTVLDYSSFGYAAGTGTTVNDMIQDAGAVNVAAKLKGWQEITQEEVVKLNPDVIIDSSGSTEKGFASQILKDPAFRDVNAVKHHRVYYVNGADLSSASQYVVKGVWDVAHLLHPTVKLPTVKLP